MDDLGGCQAIQKMFDDRFKGSIYTWSKVDKDALSKRPSNSLRSSFCFSALAWFLQPPNQYPLLAPALEV